MPVTVRDTSTTDNEGEADGFGPLVSVLIAAYNAEHFLEQAIESASRQTYRNIEIIVVNDGSTDQTGIIAERCRMADPRIHVIHQANAGVARARNKGIEESRGEFIAPLDADDLWEPTKIEHQMARMRETGENTGLVYCWWLWIDEQGTILDRSPSWRIEGNALETLVEVNYTGNASIPLYRRRCLDEVGKYDETLLQRNAQGCEDWDLALRVAAKYRVAVAPELLVGYRRVAGSMSKNSAAMWRSRQFLMEGVTERTPNISRRVVQQSNDQFALYVAGVMFWSGAYLQAVKWGMRAWKSGLLLRVLPYVVQVFLRRLTVGVNSPRTTMVPGEPLDTRRIPPPLIPYDRIYATRNIAPTAERSARELPPAVPDQRESSGTDR